MGCLYLRGAEPPGVAAGSEERRDQGSRGQRHEGVSGDGGQATKAQLNEPYEVRFDRAGNMLFVEMQNQIVRKVDAQTGIISTIAGTGRRALPATAGRRRRRFSAARTASLDASDNCISPISPITGFAEWMRRRES